MKIDALEQKLLRTDLLRATLLAPLLGVALLVFGVLGILSLREEGSPHGLLHWFHLDRELNVVTAYSAGLLLLAGWLGFALIRHARFDRPWATPVATLLVVMGFDEALKFHETLEKWSGVDWQVLYSPIILAGGASWAWFAWRGRGPERWLWIAGAGAWFLSQILEAGQWGWWWNPDERVAAYVPMMAAEELLEIAGSSLFVLALAGWLKTVSDPLPSHSYSFCRPVSRRLTWSSVDESTTRGDRTASSTPSCREQIR